MSASTGIEWTDATWNPVVGCSIVSPGCTNCYAMKQAARLLDRPGSHYHGTTRRVKGNAVWTGKLARAPDHIMTEPLRWQKPRRVFVNSMGDLFHEQVPDEWIDRAFAVMAYAQQHSFQILTKRPDRMLDYMLNAGSRMRRIARYVIDLAIDKKVPYENMCGQDWPVKSLGPLHMPHAVLLKQWPLPNVWLGVSVEDQARADARIPLLLRTPAALRFLSCEPLLGPVDLARHIEIRMPSLDSEATVNIDWVIAGGESGPNARPMHPAWVRQLRDQCNGADIPFFFKQWGEWLPVFEAGFKNGPAIDDNPEKSRFRHVVWNPENKSWEQMNGLWDDGDQWIIADDYHEPEQDMMRVGKRKAGRTLEGRTWDEMPS